MLAISHTATVRLVYTSQWIVISSIDVMSILYVIVDLQVLFFGTKCVLFLLNFRCGGRGEVEAKRLHGHHNEFCIRNTFER